MFSAFPSSAEKSLQNKIIYLTWRSTEILYIYIFLYWLFWVMAAPCLCEKAPHIFRPVQNAAAQLLPKCWETQIVFFQWLLESFGPVFFKIPGLWDGKKREPWKMGCLFYFHYSSLSTTLAVHNSRALNLNPFTKQIIFISAWYGLAVLSRGRV